MSFKLRPFILSTLLSLVSLFVPAELRAQFIGYTLPQTVTATPFATNTACTGSNQLAPIANLGQTVHSAFLLGSIISHGSIQIQASTDGVNFYPISDTVELGVASVAVFASGYYPIIQIQVVCNVGGHFGVTYAGTAVTASTPLGVQSIAQYAKSLASTDASNTTANYVFQTPYGNSGGTLYFSYAGVNGPAGSTLTVLCESPQSFGGGQGITTLPATTIPQVTPGWQLFPVNSGNCSNVTVTYTTGGASTGSFQLDYVFNYNGQAINQADPCQSAGVAKNSVAINAVAAGTTQLVALSGATRVYVCGVSMTIAPSGTSADTATFEYGTGASCGTGTTALTGAFGAGDLTTTAPPLFVTFADPGTTIKTPPGNAFCLLSAGTTVNIQGVLTYVQQ